MTSSTRFIFIAALAGLTSAAALLACSVYTEDLLLSDDDDDDDGAGGTGASPTGGGGAGAAAGSGGIGTGGTAGTGGTGATAGTGGTGGTGATAGTGGTGGVGGTGGTGGTGGPPTGVLKIVEIMFNSDSPEDDWEWIELHNGTSAPIDLNGWVVDDANSQAVAAANVGAHVIPIGGTAVLFNVGDVSLADFTAAWPTAAGHAVPVTDWINMTLNNTGDTIGLWSNWASYGGDHQAHANVVVSVTFDDTGDWPGSSNGQSIYLTDVSLDAASGLSWALSAPPSANAYQSSIAGTNTGNDEGSPALLP